MALFRDAVLVLTPDKTGGGTQADARDYVLREGGAEQMRDLGCRVVLPTRYRTGSAMLGPCLRFRASGTGLRLNFAPDANPSLCVDSIADGVATRRGAASLSGTYTADDPVAVEARVVTDAAVTVTDLTSGQTIGFLDVPLTFGELSAGSFGLVPWTTAAAAASPWPACKLIP